MKASGDPGTNNLMGAEGKGAGTGPGSGGPNPVLKTVEDNAVFDQAVARIMGSRLGIYDGQDWAGSTPEAREQIGGQMLEEAARLRESDRLVEGLALAINIGKEEALDPGEAVGRLRSGIDALGPADLPGTDSKSTDLSQGAPSDASSQPAPGNAQPISHGHPPPEEPLSAGAGDSFDHGEQLGFDAFAVADPDDQEA